MFESPELTLLEEKFQIGYSIKSLDEYGQDAYGDLDPRFGAMISM